MAAQAIMDPGKVRRFAEELARFQHRHRKPDEPADARFVSLGDTWQDQEHEKFAEEFRQELKALKKFTETSKAHTPYLLRNAQLALRTISIRGNFKWNIQHSTFNSKCSRKAYGKRPLRCWELNVECWMFS